MLLGDAGQGAQVTAALRSRFGPGAVSAFRAAKAGTHEAYQGDLKGLVRDAERLARALRA